MIFCNFIKWINFFLTEKKENHTGSICKDSIKKGGTRAGSQRGGTIGKATCETKKELSKEGMRGGSGNWSNCGWWNGGTLGLYGHFLEIHLVPTRAHPPLFPSAHFFFRGMCFCVHALATVHHIIIPKHRSLSVTSPDARLLKPETDAAAVAATATLLMAGLLDSSRTVALADRLVARWRTTEQHNKTKHSPHTHAQQKRE